MTVRWRLARESGNDTVQYHLSDDAAIEGSCMRKRKLKRLTQATIESNGWIWNHKFNGLYIIIKENCDAKINMFNICCFTVKSG